MTDNNNTPTGANVGYVTTILSSLVQAVSKIGTVLSGTLSSTSTITSLPTTDLFYPHGATPAVAGSANQANASAAATLAAVSGKTTYIWGFDINSSGSTTAVVVTVTVTGLTGSVTLSFPYASVAGALLINPTLAVRFPIPIPASAANTAIVVTLPALGAGSTHAAVCAYGYQI